jgi:hypothetical protein
MSIAQRMDSDRVAENPHIAETELKNNLAKSV